MLFKKKKSKYPAGESIMVEDAFHLLRTNIGMQSLEKKFRTFMITSTLPGEGKTVISIRLASQFAGSNGKVLLINADTRRPALEKYLAVAPSGGLSDIFYKFFAQPLGKGSVSEYGFADLCHLISLRGSSGQLILKTSQNDSYILEFQSGVLCAIVTPDNSLNTHLLKSLTGLKRIAAQELEDLLKRSSVMNVPFAKLIMDFNLCATYDLKNMYEFELLSLFRQVNAVTLTEFEFKEGDNQNYKSIAKLLDYESIFSNEKLENHHFISTTINNNVISTEKSFYLMPSGIFKMKISEIFSPGRLKKMLKILSKLFDYIIFDTPPLTVGAEATVIGSVVDASLLVIKSDHASRHKIQRAINQLKLAKVNLIGSILNSSDMHSRSSYYNYYGET